MVHPSNRKEEGARNEFSKRMTGLNGALTITGEDEAINRRAAVATAGRESDSTAQGVIYMYQRGKGTEQGVSDGELFRLKKAYSM